MMKKIIACAMSVLLLTACGSSAAPASEPSAPAASSVDVTSFKTMGDIFAANPEERQCGNTTDTFFYVFELDGTAYRAYADLSKEVSDQLFALDIFDEDYDAKKKEIAAPLEIRQFDNLTEMIPPQEELDKWVGKTGQDLLDDGWAEGFGYNLQDMDFFLFKGPFSYKVRFEKDKQYENTDDFDVWETIKPLIIESVTYDGLGNAEELF